MHDEISKEKTFIYLTSTIVYCTEKGATGPGDDPPETRGSSSGVDGRGGVQKGATELGRDRGQGGPSSFAQPTKAMLECELLAVSARLRILQELTPLNENEKMQVLFQILDEIRFGSYIVRFFSFVTSCSLIACVLHTYTYIHIHTYIYIQEPRR